MKKILSVFTIILIILSGCKAFAADYSFNISGPTEASNGETVTINITGNGLTGKVLLSAKNATLNSTQVWVEKNTVSVTAKITGFPASITASPSELSDNDYNDVTIDSKTLTINEKKDSGNNSSGGSDTGGSNTGGSGNSGSQDKPDESNVPSESNNNKPKQEVTKSSNNSLKELSIGTGKLTPEFSRDTYEYSVEFDDTVNLYDLSEIEVSATAEDEKASVRGTGKIQLTEGENNISINVTAENGAVRTYTIKVNKPQKVEQSALRLKTLVLNGINKNGEYQTINFDLDPETFEYNLTVPNEITAISINPTTENEDIIIETNGSDSLNEGKNKIVIILTSPSDNTITTTYTLNIERQAAIVENNDSISKEQIIYMAIAGGIVLIILIIIIVAIIKHKKKKQLYDYDEEDEEDIPFASNETIKDFENNTLSEEKTTEPIEEEKELKTTDDVAPSKLKWADFCEAYEDEEKIEDKQKKDKNKGGKRFL